MSKFERHFFVCQHARQPGSKPSCQARNSAAVYNTLQEGLGARQDLWGKVQVSSSGCLGPCDEGPIVVVYPEGTWYRGVTPADAKEIVKDHLADGHVVERLRHEWPSDE